MNWTAAPTSIAKPTPRYVAVKYSVRGRDLGSTVEEAMRKVNTGANCRPGYTLDWAGEYESQKRAEPASG